MGSAPRDVWGDLAGTAFVESSHLFKSLDPDARRDLLRVGQIVSFRPGEVVSDEADERFYLVREGTGSVRVATGSGTVEVARLERGALFGECRVLGCGRAATLEAASELTAVAFPAAVVSALAERFPKVRRLLETVRAAREKEAAGKVAS